MTSNFPTSLDTLSNPASGDQLSNVTTPHAAQHANVNDIVEAIEAKLGIGASAPGATAAVLRRTATGTSAWGQVQTADLATTLANRSATLVVAASNASAASIAAADYACDGTADQVEILAAMTALPAGGGRVVLTEGTFAISAAFAYPKAAVHLEGLGRGATILRIPNAAGAPVNTNVISLGQSNCSLSELTVDGNKANNAAQTGMNLIEVNANYGLVRAVHVTNSAAYGLVTQAPASYVRVLDCMVDGCSNWGLLARTATNGFTLIRGCYATTNAVGFYNDNGAILFEQCVAVSNTGNGFTFVATGSQARSCVAVANAGYGFEAIGNTVQMTGCYAGSNSNIGFFVSAGIGSQIVGCESVSNLQGITVNGGSRHVIQSNVVSLSGQYGILANAAETLVVDNKVSDSSTATNNTYSQIYLASTDGFASGNMLRRGTGGNRSNYGLQVGGTNNYIGPNDSYDSGVTANVLEAGTNTRRVAKSQLAYVAGAIMSATAIGAEAWVTIVTAQSFRVDSETSRIQIALRCALLIGASVGTNSIALRFLIDGVTAYPLSGDRNSVAADYTLIAGGSVSIYGLTGNTTHTVTLQIYSSPNASTGYCRTTAVEFCYIDVEEFQR